MELPSSGHDKYCYCSSFKNWLQFFFCTLRLAAYFETTRLILNTKGASNSLHNEYLKGKLCAKFTLLSMPLQPVDKKKKKGCLGGVQDDKRSENRYNVLCKDKKSLEWKPAKL